MAFDSSYGKYKTNEEYISRVVGVNQNDLPVFGTNGKIEYTINVPLDSNQYIKGGHMQYDTYEEILDIPSNQRIAGMESYLNTNIDLLNSFSIINNPNIVTQANKKGYIISQDQIVVSDPINGTNTFINTLDEPKHLLFNTGTKLYLSIVETGEVVEFDMLTNTLPRRTTLTDITTPYFVTNGYVVGDALYISNQASTTYLYYIDLNDFTAHKIKDIDGTTDFVADYCSTMSYDSNNNKLYIFGAGSTAGMNPNIYVIDTETNKIVTTIDGEASGLGSPMYSGVNSNCNTFISSQNKIYAVSSYEDKIFAIDTLTDSISDIIDIPTGTIPTTINIVNTTAYVNGFDTCIVVDLLSKQIITTIPTANGGGDIGQIIHYQNRLFIPNLNDGSVSVINTTTNTLVGTFNIGGEPSAISYVEGTDTLYVINQSSTIGVLNYQQSEKYILQKDLVTWEKSTAVSKSGDYIEGLLNYKTDFSTIYNDRSIPDVAYVKTLMNFGLKLDFKNTSSIIKSTIEKKHFQDWVQTDYNNISWIYDVFFVDDNVGYMCTQDDEYTTSKIKKTINGGATWFDIKTLTFSPKQIFFIGDIGYVFGDYDDALYFVKTTDGGATWSTDTIIGDDTYLVKGIHFKNSSTGVIVGRVYTDSYGFYAKTTNGGTSWVVEVLSTSIIQGIKYLGDDILYAYYDNGSTSHHLMKSTDYGDTWDDNEITDLTGSINYISDIHFYTELEYYIIGRKTSPNVVGFFAKTTNGGNTWTEVDLESDSVSKIISNSNKTAFVLGINNSYEAVVFKTNDYGDTWSSKTFSNMAEIQDGHMFNNGEKIILYGVDYDYNFFMEQKTLTEGLDRDIFVVYQDNNLNLKETISNLATPILKSDAVNKEYVDNKFIYLPYIPLTGTAFGNKVTGDIEMSSSKRIWSDISNGSGAPVSEFLSSGGSGIVAPPWNNLRCYYLDSGSYSLPGQQTLIAQTPSTMYLASYCDIEQGGTANNNYSRIIITSSSVAGSNQIESVIYTIGNNTISTILSTSGFGISTNNSHFGSIKADNITDNRNYELPNASGTFSLMDNSAIALTDASSMVLTSTKHTLTTSSATRTFTISYTGDDITLVVTLNTTDTIFTFPASTLCVSEGVASGDNTCALSGVSGDKYLINIKKVGTNFYVLCKNYGQ